MRRKKLAVIHPKTDNIQLAIFEFKIKIMLTMGGAYIE